MKKMKIILLVGLMLTSHYALFAAANSTEAAYITADPRRNLREFQRGPAKDTSPITKVTLHLNGKSFGTEGVKRLVAALPLFSTVQTFDLNLAKTGLTITELEQVLVAIAALPQLETLILDISENDCAFLTSERFAQALNQLFRLKLLNIKVGANPAYVAMFTDNLPLLPATTVQCNNQVAREALCTHEEFELLDEEIQGSLRDILLYCDGKNAGETFFRLWNVFPSDVFLKRVQQVHEQAFTAKMHRAFAETFADPRGDRYSVIEGDVRNNIKSLLMRDGSSGGVFRVDPAIPYTGKVSRPAMLMRLRDFFSSLNYAQLELRFIEPGELAVDMGGPSRRFFSLLNELLVPLITNAKGSELRPQGGESREVFLQACLCYGKLLAYSLIDRDKYPYAAVIHPYILFMVFSPFTRDNFPAYQRFARAHASEEGTVGENLQKTFGFSDSAEADWKEAITAYAAGDEETFTTKVKEIVAAVNLQDVEELADYDCETGFVQQFYERMLVDADGLRAIHHGFFQVMRACGPLVDAAMQTFSPSYLAALWPSSITMDLIGLHTTAPLAPNAVKSTVNSYTEIDGAATAAIRRRFLSTEEAAELKTFITVATIDQAIGVLYETLIQWLAASPENRQKFVKEFSGSTVLAMRKQFVLKWCHDLINGPTGQSVLFSVHTCFYRADVNLFLLVYHLWRCGSPEEFARYLQEDVFPQYFGIGNDMNIV